MYNNHPIPFSIFAKFPYPDNYSDDGMNLYMPRIESMPMVGLQDESDEDNFYWQDAIIRHASPLGFYDLQVVFDNEQAGEILERVLPEDVRLKPTDTSLQIGVVCGTL